ncbi:MFS transporter [Corynebacterium sp. H113]|uniref:MFS transporter n=1 Tax=Corynebacterium sp. H113 TaxID=3133419 RepID=UPI00309F6279
MSASFSSAQESAAQGVEGGSTQSVQAPHPHRWWALAVLACGIVILAVDMTVLNFALPAISRDLQPSGTQLLWIIDIYAFALASLLITMGTLGDRIGRRKLLLIGIAGFAVASVIAAMATSSLMLIIARALQGIFGATLMPSTLSIIKAMFTDPKELSRAIAAWISCYSLGAIIGPVLGGWLLEHFHWGSVFLINVPVAAIIFIGGVFIIPESVSRAPGRFDVVGAVLSITALFGLVGALKAVTAGLALWVSLGLLVVAIGLGVLFVAHLNNTQFPLVDVRLLRSSAYSTAVIVNLVSSFLLVGVMFYLTQYLQVVLELSPVHAGLLLMPGMIVSMVFTVVTGELVSRVPARRLLVIALLLTACGLSMHVIEAFGQWEAIPSGPLVNWWFGASFMIIGAGVGMLDPVTNTIILGAAPPEQSGAASALSETGYELGAAFGAAVLGAVLISVYSFNVVKHDFGVDASELSAISSNVNNAHAFAESLTPEAATQVVSAANDAFVTGMGVTAAVAAALCVVAAVGVRLVLPNLGVHEMAESERH